MTAGSGRFAFDKQRDTVREFSYGADSKIGTFSDALMAEAKQNGWTVISMKNDWKRVFAFDK